MKVADLKNDLTITEWLDTLNPKPNTEKNYLLAMQTFTDWTGKEPEELLTEAEEEIRAGKLMRQRQIKRDLIGFRKYLQNSGKAPTTVKNYLTGVKSFYRLFDIEIPTLSRSGDKARPLEKHNHIPSKEDLQETLKVCDPLERAIILCGVSSGLAANELINLKVGTFKEGYDPESEITTLRLRREKVGFDFVTFLSPEASRAVWDYLEYRGRTVKTGETRRLRQLEKQKVFSDNDYLFIGRHIPDTWIKTRNEEERKLEHYSFMKVYRAISEKAQKNTLKGDWNLIRSHNIRKYFNSTMLNSGADSFFVEFCMGHTLDDTRSAYFRAAPDKLRDIYHNFVPYLTIQKDLDISESPEYQKIKKENQVLQAETARHIVERSELKELRAEFEIMKESIGFLSTEALRLATNDPAIVEGYTKKLIEK